MSSVRPGGTRTHVFRKEGVDRAEGPSPGRQMRSKYRAVRTTVDNIAFASKKEAARYSELRLLEKAGHIRSLQLQPEYLLSCDDGVFPGAAKVLLGRYVADFKYEERGVGGHWYGAVEDVKGFKTPLYKWKKKHVEAQYGITIREIL